MNALDIIEAVNGLEEDLLAETLTEEKNETEEDGRKSGSFRRLPRWIPAAACLAIMILAGAALGGSGRATAVEDPQAETHMMEDYWMQSVRQSNASRIYHVIVQNFFSYDQHGMPLYPDDCGDAYIDGEMLVLCLKDPDQAMIDKYLSVLHDGKKWVRIRAVKYSRNELQAIADEMARYLREQKIPVYFYGVDVMINGIDFGTDPEYTEIMEQLIQERYPDVPANVIPSGPAVWT